jgi:hypothetical protein
MGEHVHHPGSYSNDGLWDEVFIQLVVKGLGGRQFVDSVVVNGDYPLEYDESGELIIPTKDDEIRRVIYMSAALVADEVVAFRKERRS